MKCLFLLLDEGTIALGVDERVLGELPDLDSSNFGIMP